MKNSVNSSITSLPGREASKDDKALFDLHNEVRENPKSMIPLLEEMLEKFDGNIYIRGDGRPKLQTKEGSAAVKDAIGSLKRQSKTKPLNWNANMAQASKDHT